MFLCVNCLFNKFKSNDSHVSSPGIVLTVAVNERRLDLSLLVPDDLAGPHTRGLFGLYDAFPGNDLTPLRTDGNNGIARDPSRESERSIFDNFAESCTLL